MSRPDTAPSTGAVYIARQAIYDRNGDVLAYELLFRDAPVAEASSHHGSEATTQVLIAAFTEFGIHELVGERAGFVNVTREFLVGDLPLPLEPAQVGLEILADIPVDPELLAGVAALSDQGYTIVLDNYAPGQGREALLELASYAKIDLLDGNAVRARATVAQCRQHKHLQPIAQRIETPALFTLATSLGFELFQGHALGRPHLLSTRTLSAGRLQRLQLLTELTDPELDLDRITAAVEADPALAMRVLRTTNSAATGLPRKVSSIGDAVVLLGPARIRQWATLMLASDVADGSETDLQEIVLSARLCQLLAHSRGVPTQPAFTVGLLAAMAELLAIPTSELATNFPLADQITDALVDGAGELGQVLTDVRAYQSGDLSAGTAEVSDALLAALRWTTAVVHTTVPTG